MGSVFRKGESFCMGLFGGTFVAVFAGACLHATDALFCVGMGREHLGDVAIVGGAFHLLQFFEGHHHAVGVNAVSLEKVVTVVVGFFLLLLRIFCRYKGFSERAEYGA